jgi:hypothetical protein
MLITTLKEMQDLLEKMIQHDKGSGFDLSHQYMKDAGISYVGDVLCLSSKINYLLKDEK